MQREKERAQAAAQQAARAAAHSQQQHALAHTQHHLTTNTTHKRKRDEERETPTSAKSKKKKMISTTSTKENKKDTKLYCICKTPYDETKYATAHWKNSVLKTTTVPLLTHKHVCALLCCEGFISVATCVQTGIMATAWESQKRRQRRWTTISASSVNEAKRVTRRSCTASVRLHMMSLSKEPKFNFSHFHHFTT